MGKKARDIHIVLWKNKEKLINFLEGFLPEKAKEDEAFAEEKKIVIKHLSELPVPEEIAQHRAKKKEEAEAKKKEKEKEKAAKAELEKEKAQFVQSEESEQVGQEVVVEKEEEEEEKKEEAVDVFEKEVAKVEGTPEAVLGVDGDVAVPEGSPRHEAVQSARIRLYWRLILMISKQNKPDIYLNLR